MPADVQITNDDATGTFVLSGNPAIGIPVGGFAPQSAGVADNNGVIILPSPVTVSTLTTYMGTITTMLTDHQAVGQMFWVRLDYWDICNPYNSSNPLSPAPVSIQNSVQIINQDCVVTGLPQEYVGLNPFPNPSSGTFYVSGELSTLDIFDITGRRVTFTLEAVDKYIKIQIVNPSPGILVLKGFLSGNYITRKVVMLP